MLFIKLIILIIYQRLIEQVVIKIQIWTNFIKWITIIRKISIYSINYIEYNVLRKKNHKYLTIMKRIMNNMNRSKKISLIKNKKMII